MNKPTRRAKPDTIAVTHQQSFHGPIPPPALLEHYDQIIPGAAERILAMAESETAHRQRQETLAIEANRAVQQHQINTEARQTELVFRSDMTGQILGFLLSLASVAGCIWLAVSDHIVAAMALAALPLTGIIRALRTPKK